MDETVKLSRLRISRRRAMSISGAVGLTGLLSACGGSDTTSSGTTSTTSAITAAPASGDVVALLDRANTCVSAKEQT